MNGNPVQRVYLDGKRVITESLPYFHSVALGIFFKQGSRDDGFERQGLTHLIEHMFFKGTQKRSAKELSLCIESLGGVMDGFTSRDTTGIYARFASEHLRPVIELLGEILSQPKFDAKDFLKEKEVIYEEIKSIEENPEDMALELLLKALYAPHPLSFPVTGSEATIRNLSRDELVRYYEHQYRLDKVLVVAVGDVRTDETYEGVRANLLLKPGTDGEKRIPPLPQPPRLETKFRSDLSQVYIGLGKPVIAYTDERRYALSVLNTALGGGLSSRLFQRLREEEGLVYSVSSFLELGEDSGLLGIFFITDKQKLARTFSVIFKEIEKLRKQGLTPEELEVARNLTKGTLVLNLENPTARMMRWARLELILGRLVGVEETLERYTAITRDDINQLIDEIFNDQPFSLSGVGPLSEKELEKILKEQS